MPTLRTAMTCPRCGSINVGKMTACLRCHTPLAAPQPAPSAQPGSPAAVCGACGAALEPGYTFCASCGRKLETPAPSTGRVCANCHAVWPQEYRFCMSCGKPL